MQACRDEINSLRDELIEQTSCIQRLSPETYQQVQTRFNGSHVPSTLHVGSLRSSTSEGRPIDHCEEENACLSDTLGSNRASITGNREPHSGVTSRTELDRILLLQRPYRAAARRASNSSFDSRGTQTKHVAWSWVSTFSISDVSNISLLELPLDIIELYRSDLWRVGLDNPASSGSLRALDGTSKSSDLGLLVAVNHLYGAAKGQERLFLRSLQRSRRARLQVPTWILQKLYMLTFRCITQDRPSAAKEIVKDAVDGCIRHGVSSQGWNEIVQLQQQHLYWLSDWQHVEQLFLLTLEVCRQCLGPENVLTRNVAFNIGLSYQQRQHNKEAEDHLIWALEWSRRNTAGDDETILDVIRELAENYSSVRQDEEAERVLLRVLNMYGAVNDYHQAMKIDKELARVYKLQKRFDEAESALLRGICRVPQPRAQDGVSRDSSATKPRIFIPGNYLQLQNLVTDSQNSLKKADELSTFNDVLRMLAHIYRLQRKREEAEKLFLWMIRSASYAGRSQQIGKIYCELGCLWQAEDRYDKAQIMFSHALQAGNGKRELDIYWQHIAHMGLGDCYDGQGKSQDSGKSYSLALKCGESVQRNSVRSHEVAFNMGCIYGRMGSLQEAETKFKSAVDGYAGIFGRDSHETLKSAELFCENLVRQSKLVEAEECMRFYNVTVK